MRIYISHLRRGNYEKELYEPLKQSALAQKHTFIFPHSDNQKPFNTQELFQTKGCDMVLAEISYPATGQGIELGWADMFQIPIYCMYKTGSDVSRSALMIAKEKVEYMNNSDMIKKLEFVIPA
jgi:hypothetical protein